MCVACNSLGPKFLSGLKKKAKNVNHVTDSARAIKHTEEFAKSSFSSLIETPCRRRGFAHLTFVRSRFLHRFSAASKTQNLLPLTSEATTPPSVRPSIRHSYLFPPQHLHRRCKFRSSSPLVIYFFLPSSTPIFMDSRCFHHPLMRHLYGLKCLY